MTREEQIIEAANMIYRHHTLDYYAFRRGAQWADKNPIKKEQCNHPPEKINFATQDNVISYICECGTRVFPTAFSEEYYK